jgi:hypothetical protein
MVWYGTLPAGVTGTKVFTADGGLATITTASAIPTPAAAAIAAATHAAAAPAGVHEHETGGWVGLASKCDVK